MKIGTVLRKYRAIQEINLRDLAKEIGTSAPTLTRLEQGHGIDNVTMLALINWLFSPERK